MKIIAAMIDQFKSIGFVENPLGGFSVGTKVEKVNAEEGDANPNGAKGTVMLGIMLPSDLISNGVTAMYIVDWGNGVPIAIVDRKLKEVK